MDIRLSEEQEALRDSARQMLARHCTPEVVRSLRGDAGPHAHDELWKRVVDAGWLELGLSDDSGGTTMVELGLVCREAGRHLLPTLFYSVLEAVVLLDGLGGPAARTLLDAAVNGSTWVVVAFAEESTTHQPDLLRSTARRTASGWELDVEKVLVRSAQLADVLLVACRTPGGLGLFAVDPKQLDVVPHATFGKDPHGSLSGHTLVIDDQARIAPLDAGTAEAAWRRARAVMTAMASLDLAGSAQALLDHTVAHLKVRHVFGKPLGSFQAAQHIVADMAIRAKGADLAGLRAAWAVGHGEAAHEVDVAKVWAGRAAKENSVWAHQLHGGMGFVTETDLHLWSDRVMGMDAGYGTASQHLNALAETVRTSAMDGSRRDGLR